MGRFDGWITKKALLKQTGTTTSQLQRWHKEMFAYSSEPMHIRRGNGRGSVTLYHPAVVAIARRILQIKALGQRDFTFWRWQLWLDGLPISVKRDCIGEIEQIMKDVALPEGYDTLDVIEEALSYVDKSETGSMMAHVQRRIANEADRHSLLVWLMYTAVGEKPLAGWHDVVDAEDPLDMLWPPEEHPYPTLGQLFAAMLGAPKEWAEKGPAQEVFSLSSLVQVLEGADEEEWEQARRDWHSIVRLLPYISLFEKLSKGVPIKLIADLYYEAHERAILTSIMIQARRSNMKGDLATALEALDNLASTIEALIQTPIPHALGSEQNKEDIAVVVR